MAYTTATFTRIAIGVSGAPSIVLTYTGNNNETPVEDVLTQNLVTMPTADYIRGLAMARLKLLNNNINFVIGATPSIGSVLDTTTPLPAPAASTFGSFMAASAPFTPGPTPTDIFSITGSATRLVQVLRMALTTVQTTAGMNAFVLAKRSAANTGGTSAVVTAVPSDSAYPNATATVRQYTANPSGLGALVGSVWSGRIAAPAPASAPFADAEKIIKHPAMGAPIVTLRGVNDVLAWNLNGVVLPPGLSVQASAWWTEQA